ncbi:endonuclease/exonuclease/phosphatase family protein [Angustibacter aerolatus]
MTRLRLGTWNLASGRTADGRQASPQALADAVAALDVDVLAVQELDLAQAGSGGVDQLALVAQALGAAPGGARFVPTLLGRPGPRDGWRPAGAPGDDDLAASEPDVGMDAGAPAGVGVPGRGDATGASPDARADQELGGAGRAPDGDSGAGPRYGIGLVSRYPVLAWRVRRLPASRAVLPFPVPVEGSRVPRLLLVPDEPRAALAAVVDAPGGPLTVVCTHLSFAPVAASRQLRTVTRWARELPGPRLLAGDLNLPGGLPARLSGWRSLVRAASYPAQRPRLQLDHLLLDEAVAAGGSSVGAGLARLGAVTPESATPRTVSDHVPLVVTVDR